MTENPGTSRLTIILLVDALGWEIARRFEFCKDVFARFGPIGTVLGYSSAAIPSLLTGVPPEVHGAWAMWKLSPASSPFRFFRRLPRLPHALEWRLRAWARRLVERRRTIEGYYDLYEIPLNVLGYFDVAHHGDPYAIGGAGQESFFDRLSKEDVPFHVWNYRTPEGENFEALRCAIDSPDRVLFLYTADLDALMHRVGTTHPDVAEKLAGYERWVARLLETAEASGRDTTLFLFSDHEWGYRVGRRFMAFYDSTMARFWCDAVERQDLARRLEDTGWGRVFTREELASRGCGFEDNSYGDLIFLVKPGRLIVPSYMGSEPLAAMHGYDPEDPSSAGCFFSTDGAQEMPRSILDLKRLLVDHVLGGA
jgi:hypothetical protein